MRAILPLLLLIHGLLHVLGFLKGFRLGTINSLTLPVSRINGLLWLFAMLLLLLSSLMLYTKKDYWWIISLTALLLSQYLLISYWQEAKYGTIANIILLLVTAIGFAEWRFQQAYKASVSKELLQSFNSNANKLTEDDIRQLPYPVQQYIRYTGAIGQPKVRHFQVSFKGEIRKNATARWMPFSSEQNNFMDAAVRLFFMKATMKQLPVAGLHSFNNGTATMDIRLLSLFRVQYQEGKEMGIAETVTFFNDMCCMAPATLIDQRIEWGAVNGDTVTARFRNNGIVIKAQLIFNEGGQLVNFISDDRYAAGEDGSMKQIRWSTPLSDYRLKNGSLLAHHAELNYAYPEGEFCYGKFELINIRYNPQVIEK